MLNPLPTKAICFRKQESMYKALMPNIKPPNISSYELIGIFWAQ